MKPHFCISIFLILFGLPQFALAQQPPVVPSIDKTMKFQLRNVYKTGVAAGNRPTVFAKVGDSITRSKYFQKDIGCSAEVLANHQSLASTIQFFRGTAFPPSYTTVWCGRANSFSRDSLPAQNGWTAAEPLTKFPNPLSACPPPDDNPLRCEFRLLKPSIALIMLGTNDLEEDDPEKFRANLSLVVQETMLSGVVPVLSTIPPRLDNPIMGRRVATYNNIIQEVATMLQVPLWNYWLSLRGPAIIHQGMDAKGIHPNVFNLGEPAIFTTEGLRYGFNQRNLTSVYVLKKIKSVIQDRKRSDSTTLPNFTIYPTQYQTTVERGNSIHIQLRIARINLSDPIKFRINDPPEGISGDFELSSTGKSVTLTLTAESDMAPGDYRITVRGKIGTLKRTTTIALEVTR